MPSNYHLNYYKNVRSPKVLGSIYLEDIFAIIRIGGHQFDLINQARKQLKAGNKTEYKRIKETLLSVSYAFRFRSYKKNSNILKATGLLPIDLDGSTKLIRHKYVYASYISLSGRGRLYLIKVEGLTQYNFKHTYKEVSNLIGLNSDLNAAKPTQPFIIPHSDVYINRNSKTYRVKSNETRGNYVKQKKGEVIGTVIPPNKARFSNENEIIDSINFNGEAIYDFKKKIEFAKIKVPIKHIKEGNRNKILSSIGYQFRALNPNCSTYDIENLIQDINQKFADPFLPREEIKNIAKSIYKIPKNELIPINNETKRFFFNPDYQIPNKEKRRLVMQMINENRSLLTRNKIKEAINNWDIIKQGEINKKRLAKASGKSPKTIRKYYPEFKKIIDDVNNRNYFKPP